MVWVHLENKCDNEFHNIIVSILYYKWDSFSYRLKNKISLEKESLHEDNYFRVVFLGGGQLRFIVYH